jgi:hypothetical protein
MMEKIFKFSDVFWNFSWILEFNGFLDLFGEGVG